MSTSSSDKPVILIGSLSKTNPGAIPAITTSFIDGLSSKYNFVPHFANRRFGSSSLSKINVLNVYYLLKHLVLWCFHLVFSRPHIAHYPVTSHWNLEKSLLFLIAAKLLGSKAIGHLHGGAFISSWKKRSKQRRYFALKGLEQLDAFVVTSEGWKHQIAAEIGVDRGKIFAVRNPIDSNFEDFALKTPVKRENRNILSLGVMARDKGIFDIIEASRIVLPGTDLNLLLVGNEREPGIAKACHNLLREYSLTDNVQLVAWTAEKENLFENASLFLLPSYYENLPLVILEAAAAGLSIITTPVGAIPEFFVHNKSVYFVEPGNVQEIARAMIELMNDSEKRYRIARGAREVFQNKFSREKIMQSLDTVYQKVLA